MRWERAVAAAGDLLLGARCAGCGAPWLGVCPVCRRVLDGLPVAVTWPDPTPDHFPLTVAAGPYAGELQGLVSTHKEEQALVLTPVLAARLTASLRCLLSELGAGASALGVVPVPSAAAAVRRRGFDATAALARAALRRLRTDHPGLRLEHQLAQRHRVRDQAGLTAQQRAQNLAGGFRLRSRPGPYVLLVDDVVTTGASLSEAARTLEEHGIRVLGAATVAATRLRAGVRPGAVQGLRTG